jgi:hypothetical protein
MFRSFLCVLFSGRPLPVLTCPQLITHKVQRPALVGTLRRGRFFTPPLGGAFLEASFHLQTFLAVDTQHSFMGVVAYYDSYVPVIRPTREHSHWAHTCSVAWDRETLQSFDAVIIATNHQAIDYQELADCSPCIVDTRNAMAGVKTKSGQVWKA